LSLYRFRIPLFYSLIFIGVAALISGCQPGGSITPTSTSRARSLEQTRSAEATMRSGRTASAVEAAVAMTQTSAAVIRNAGSPTPLPTYTFQPTYTPYPTYTILPRTSTLARAFTVTPRPTFAPIFYPVEVSVTEFYCTKEPTQVKISALLPTDMGAAIYYRLREKKSRQMTDWEKKDLALEVTGARSAVINGSIYTTIPSDITYPALPQESVLEFQIISDDGSYKSIVYTSITYFPCPGQE
jgi:hypothetical protein